MRLRTRPPKLTLIPTATPSTFSSKDILSIILPGFIEM